MAFLKNAWYMAAWSEEVSEGTLLVRTFLDEPVLMYRQAGGELVALHDRCPHRSAPLSMGQREGDGVRCGYHGLRFDATGRCDDNPHGPVPAKACVRRYETADKHGIAWIWMGDHTLADTATIPDLSRLHGAPATAQSKAALPTACHYQLVVDNVMDLSHVEYLHSSTLGGGAFVASKATVVEDGLTVTVRQTALNQAAPPVYDQFMTRPGQPVDFLNEVIWQPPGIMKLNIKVDPVDGSPSLHTYNVHVTTPETATTSHYWYWLTREYRTDDTAITAKRHAQMTHVFTAEDKPMLEAQQRRLGTADLFSTDPVLLGTDVASVKMRRIMCRLMQQEAEGAPYPGGIEPGRKGIGR